MAASTSSTSSTTFMRKGSKNPGLSLILTPEASCAGSSKAGAVYRRGSWDSLYDTPQLEPDWSNHDEESEGVEDDGAQYIYIPAGSPFYRRPSSPRTSGSSVSFTGFPFTCGALAEDDPLFSQSPREIFDEDLELKSDPVVVIASESTDDISLHRFIESNLVQRGDSPCNLK
ncbi:hypothetical protein H0H81_011928 [Sphagnurus paluster]|uniref:Uncharacterized protein n=1 Tax=Sphagnurus paluster TaxID=117069 RepID=A0A9P7GL43_9AGAR|nr:hypothetical protein H0H81_011928 [Sphagnurus paluster]